jgi:hypothetical protein
MITGAERRFPVRIGIAVPPDGLGRRHPQITARLDENCSSNGWAMTLSGVRGAVYYAISIYFADATFARDDPAPHMGAEPNSTPSAK